MYKAKTLFFMLTITLFIYAGVSAAQTMSGHFVQHNNQLEAFMLK